ncbi:hypothetical protein KCP73_15940 [Salmonella enterica subsp. enterica]|nr:hypothetical protein KCP73_15940 [Salmonella enterica subsp. enterica]
MAPSLAYQPLVWTCSSRWWSRDVTNIIPKCLNACVWPAVLPPGRGLGAWGASRTGLGRVLVFVRIIFPVDSSAGCRYLWCLWRWRWMVLKRAFVVVA